MATIRRRRDKKDGYTAWEVQYRFNGRQYRRIVSNKDLGHQLIADMTRLNDELKRKKYIKAAAKEITRTLENKKQRQEVREIAKQIIDSAPEL